MTAAPPAVRAKLRYIHHGDFRKNEATLAEEAKAEVAKLYKKSLGSGDCVILVSGNGKILRFILGVDETRTIDGKGQVNGHRSRVLISRTCRITSGYGTFNEYMIAHYAAELGITLERIQSLASHLARVRRSVS